MKKYQGILPIFIVAMWVTVSLYSCSKFTGSKTPLYEGDIVEEHDSSRNILVAYFSISGNTEKVAKFIADETGGTLYRIERNNPYPKEFRVYADEAKKELDDSIFPIIKDPVTDFDRYDVVFVGCPVWWHTTPRIISSFLEKQGYDFSNKIVVPFCTYANMFPHETLYEIVKETPGAIHPDGFVSEEGDTTGIYNWLQSINMIQNTRSVR